jgi:WD40 repeat protein
MVDSSLLGPQTILSGYLTRILSVYVLSVHPGMQSSHSLQPLLTILKAHEFPPTTLRFSPTSNLLVSGSADNSVRVISVPADLGGQCEFWSYYFLYLKLIHLFVCSVGNLVSNHIDIDRFSVGYRVPKVAVIDRLAS